ncbi:MAG TPA: NAD(P)/FAD-dependent oxidoreductase [Syntrophales bacterium]|nr:NAD(P)/FAD-dependent oxidoreductase [Syntrophales bacterium]HPB70231.1 NAD(P)/FAD-dependent oxidoreductase [Syntrophales bacterium]HQN25718.1 NAD(P)/FAD-dependent oxidoreductase [Syntrophales bacterium]
MKTWDVIVVGAGPGGSTTAARLAMAGCDVLLVDKERFPREKPCSDIYGRYGVDAYKEIGAYDELLEKGFLFPELMLTSPDYTALKGPNVLSVTCPRRVGDNILKEAAARQGAKVLEAFWVNDLMMDRGRVVGVKAKYEGKFVEYPARIVIGADGSHSWVAKHLGLFSDNYDEVFLAGRAYYADCDPPLRTMEVHYDPYFFPGFVCLSPHPGYGDVVNVGIGYQMTPYVQALEDVEALTRKFIETSPFGEKLRKARKVSDWMGWRVPSAGQIGKTYAAGAMLIGDAGSFVDPFILEGIANSVRSGGFAVQTALEALEKGDFSESFLSVYEARWREKMKPRLDALQQMALVARNAEMLNATFQSLKANPAALKKMFG